MKRYAVPTLMLLSLMFQACGPSKIDNQADLTSRIRNPPNVNSTDSSKIYAYCSSNSKAPLQAALSAVATPLGEVDIDLAYLKIMGLNSDFEEKEDYIQFFKWKGTADGIVYQDPTPLYFNVVSADTQTQLNAELFKSANWNQLAPAATYVAAEDMKTLIQKSWFRIELKDPYGDYDVIRMVVYSKDHKAKHSIDVLLPVFPAKPSEYAFEKDGSKRLETLQRLHPLRLKSGEEGNTSHFRSLALELCNPFDK